MAGEWSKKIGETGEVLVLEYLKMIGWANAQKGLDVVCNKPTKHRHGGNNRQSHGIDYIFSYRSPLLDGVLNNLLISVKFTADTYPNSPAPKFKDYFTDLAFALECFKNSQRRNEIIKGYSGINKAQDVGVLFWISGNKDSYDDVIAKIANTNQPSECDSFEAIYVVDNKKIGFGFSSLSYAKRQYPSADMQFFYHDTGKNINPLIGTKSGCVLPVEFVNASVLTFRIDLKENGNVLLLTVDEPFSGDSLQQLIGLTRQLSQNWAAKTLICYPDYTPLNHENTVQQVKATFSDTKTTEKIEVRSYATDFLTLQEGK